ncbi:bifunctional tetrahydrofolate synthase/dihydrofolate synthase [Buchnera aphidicola (Taiwanaphis decaspermi)]|uniref:bifunctional tetrahydrofolate synthase/dihydrofolate synthase n=1 Tax=Buchnera aphidicola TaxID=9 RepID=UPI0031B82726
MYKSKPNINSSLNYWLNYITSIQKDCFYSNFGLIYKLSIKYNLNKLDATIIVVSGTNAKGSTCNILEKLLSSFGYKVGLYTSPHLIKYTERLKINGCYLSDIKHIHALTYINYIRKNIRLTYFEFSTLSILYLLKQYKLDFIILEVGLGGRLDATNIIDSDISIITNIDLDHTKLLGSNRESISLEKAGIFRNFKKSIIGETNIPKNIYKIAQYKNTILIRNKHEWLYNNTKHFWSYHDIQGSISNLPYNVNASCKSFSIAISTIRNLNIIYNINKIKKIVKDFHFPGRFNIISKNPKIILDVTHNPNGSNYLFKKLSYLSIKGKLYILIGMLKDKNIEKTIFPFISITDIWYCVSLNTIRGSKAYQIAKYLNKNTYYMFDDIKKAYNSVCKKAKKKDTILVFGSFFLISEIIKINNINIL